MFPRNSVILIISVISLILLSFLIVQLKIFNDNEQTYRHYSDAYHKYNKLNEEREKAVFDLDEKLKTALKSSEKASQIIFARKTLEEIKKRKPELDALHVICMKDATIVFPTGATQIRLVQYCTERSREALYLPGILEDIEKTALTPLPSSIKYFENQS